jgi:putative transposase
MRQARIKVPAGEAEAVYHCISRTVNGEWLFDDAAKEVLRRQLWQVAEFCGVQIVTYAILSNHFHVLAQIPKQAEIPDAELLRRHAVLYPRPTPFQATRLDVVQTQLATNGPEAVAWRRRQTALMGDVSQFMKLLKQRFSIWFNKSHDRFGTLWAERFKSELIEPQSRAVRAVAAYVDLNGVRAGLVADPMEYRFCGYAEAAAGKESAQAGICFATGETEWRAAQAHYREVLFTTGAGPREGAATISPTEALLVLKNGGQLPLPAVLRCRIRHFIDGAVLGSQAFVAEQLTRYRRETARHHRTEPRNLPAWTEWGDLTTLRGLRRRALT